MSVQGLSAVLVAAEVGSCLLFFETFFQERYPEKKWVKRIGYFVMFFLFLVTANLFSDYTVLKACMTIIEIVIITNTIYMEKWIKAILFGAWYYSMGFAVEAVCYYALNGMGLGFSSVKPLWKFVVFGGMCKLLFLLIILLIRQKKSNMVKETALVGSEWIAFVFFPIFSLIVCIQILSEKQIKTSTACLISIGLLLGNFMLYFLLQNTLKRKEMEKKLALIQEQTQHQAREYRYIQESYEQQRKKVAEFRKELHEVKGFLQREDVCGGLSYIENCDWELAYHSNYFNTTNDAVNTVLTYQYLEAKKEGIALIYEITRITNLPMAEEKAMVLIGMLLSRGIDFCREHKFTQIRFKLAEQMSYLVLSLKMPCPQEMLDLTLEDWKTHLQDAAFCQIVTEAHGEEQIHVDCCDGTICYTILFRKNEQ